MSQPAGPAQTLIQSTTPEHRPRSHKTLPGCRLRWMSSGHQGGDPAAATSAARSLSRASVALVGCRIGTVPNQAALRWAKRPESTAWIVAARRGRRPRSGTPTALPGMSAKTSAGTPSPTAAQERSSAINVDAGRPADAAKTKASASRRGVAGSSRTDGHR